MLDAVRLGPGGDETAVTAAQVRDVVGRLIAAGQHTDGDLDILVVFDAGYDVTRLACLLADSARRTAGAAAQRSRAVLPGAAPAARPRTAAPARRGRFKLADPQSWPAPQVTTATQTTRYGTAVARAWDRLHPRLTRRAAWAGR